MSSGGSGQTRVRRRFEETAHWVANLVTDKRGTARTKFSFPDNITDWRFTARGVTADTRVGEIRVQHKTLLPLQVELALPRGFRSGDRIDLPVVLHNNTDKPRTVRGISRIGKKKEQPWPARPLDANGVARLTIPLAAADTKPIKLFAAVEDTKNKDADATERTLVPLPRGFHVTRGYSGLLDKNVTIPIDLGSKATGDGLKLTIRREPGLAGPISSALDELIDYPYGCVEQTMSRFMPAVVAARAMKDAKIENPAAARLPDVCGKGIARLQEFQHRDGGWGWWKGDATNDYMTAYVLKGLVCCEAAGHPVPHRMVDAAGDYLAERLQQNRLEGRRPHDVEGISLPVYAAHALATLYHQSPKSLEKGHAGLRAAVASIERNAATLSLLDKILLVDTRRLLGDTQYAKERLTWLSDRFAMNDRRKQTIVEAAALLELGAALEPDNPRWPRLARQLVLARCGTGWGDTLTTSAAIRGLSAVLCSAPVPDIPITVRVDGRKVGVLTPGSTEPIELTVGSVKQIALQPAKRGCRDFYSVRLDGHLEKPPKNPKKPEVVLRTRVFVLQPGRREVSPDELGRLVVQRGATLEIELEAKLKRPISHARLTLPRPCGVELVRSPKLFNGPVAIEQHDDAIHFFIDHWDRGTHRVSFLVKPEISGTLSSPPPELAPMYSDTHPTAVFAPARWIVKEQGPAEE